MKRSILLSMLLLLSFARIGDAQNQNEFQVLHFSRTSGFNHQTSDESLGMFETIGESSGFTVTQDGTGTEFNSLANLQQYAVVVFSNTSGNNILNATQRANFEAYIQAGGSYLGIHAASDTYRHSGANGGSTGTWDWYAETVAGCSVQQNPNHTSQNHNNFMNHIDVGHPVLEGIPNPWNKTEEYYYWENGYLAPGFTEILRVEQTGNNSYDMPRMTAHVRDLPGGGRAFYTSLGHSSSNFESDQNFIRLISNAVDWTAEPNVLTTEVVAPSNLIVTRGILASGSVGELESSDNVDVSIRRAAADIQARTEFESTGVSPSDSPTALSIVLESSVFARSNIVQTIEVFDFSNQIWVSVDSRNAMRFSDLEVEVELTGDLTRFLAPATNELRSRIRFQSTSPRQQYASNIDRLVWSITY